MIKMYNIWQLGKHQGGTNAEEPITRKLEELGQIGILEKWHLRRKLDKDGGVRYVMVIIKQSQSKRTSAKS